jgi:hypothetical protein
MLSSPPTKTGMDGQMQPEAGDQAVLPRLLRDGAQSRNLLLGSQPPQGAAAIAVFESNQMDKTAYFNGRMGIS